MNRKVKAVAVVAVVAVMSVGAVMVINPLGTQFRYEKDWTFGFTGKGWISIESLRDCNVTLSFVNDSSVFYRLNIELYGPTFRSSAFKIRGSQGLTGGSLQFTAISRIRSMNIVLGSGMQYDIFLGSSVRLNTTIIYSNSARMGDYTRIRYSADGILRFAFTESVNFTDWGMECVLSASPMGTAYVSIDLPDGMVGLASLGAENVYTIELSGWYYRGGNDYSTAISVQEPLLDMTAQGTTVYASLRD
jgi:hypothetical protein